MRLYSKLLLSVVPAALLSGQVIIVYSGKATHKALLSGIEKAGLEKSADLAAAMAPGFVSGSEKALLPALQSCQRGTSARYVAALDGGGHVLSHTNVAEVGLSYGDAFTLSALAASQPTYRETRSKDQPVLDIYIPVFQSLRKEPDDDFMLSGSAREKKGRRVGTLRVGLPLNDALATERRISGKILRIVLVSSGLTILLLLLLLRGVLAPIQLLAAGTAKIRAGEYGSIIPIDTKDEIGALAASFNEMSRILAATVVSKDFFNDILQNLRDQLFVTDPEGNIDLVNPALLRLLGYSKEELIGRPASILFDEKESVLAGPGLERIRREGSLQNIGTHLLNKAKEKIPVLFSCSVLKDKAGTMAGFIGVAKDVSDVRKLEARMHQSEKLSAVGQLAAGVAHEINNPLGVILGFSQGMSRQIKPGDALELPVKSIEREALRCKNLVQNLLTFARTSQSDRIAMDVNQSVEQALALISAQAKMTQVQIKAELAKGLPPILGNKNQIEQVILNLAKNALDAMPNGGSLSLSTQLLQQAPQAWVCLKVADTGTGIPMSLMTKIFEPFFTTKPVGQGTGLGLSLISEIVKKHSGDVEVESRPGMTVFTVKFPVRTGREMEERLQVIRQDKLASQGSGPGGGAESA